AVIQSQIFKEVFKIRSYQVGPSGLVTPQSLLRFLQEAAANHAEILRVGGEELVEQDLMWVLSRLRLKMHRTPKWHDDITVETWPSKRTKGV
ncbi:acyl-ACP thioesterase domain-containing protein, partial [Acinetobacter baumannii]